MLSGRRGTILGPVRVNVIYGGVKSTDIRAYAGGFAVHSIRRYYLQNDLRRMGRIVMNGIVGGNHASIVAQRFAGVGIDVEPGVIAARTVDANAMSFLEHRRIGIKGNRDLGNFARLERGC